MRKTLLVLGGVLLMQSLAVAGINPPGPGEEVVYQTVQSGSQYRTGFSQITGNAYSELGDEIKLDGTARYVTNVAVATQTFNSPDTLSYQPAYIQLTLYANDGPPDPSGGSLIDAPPHGQARPGTILWRTEIDNVNTASPFIYPAGGVPKSDTNFMLNFALPQVLVPQIFSFGVVNLDENHNPDITYGVNPPANPNNWQQPSFRFGLFHSTGQIGTPFIPASGGPFYYGTAYNTNVVGTSRTGPDTNRFTANGQWAWIKYNGDQQWESDRDSNQNVDSTMNAGFDPIFGDMDGNGVVDNFDIQPFELALTDSATWQSQHPYLTDRERRGDIDGDGDFDNFDIQPFENLLTGGALAGGAAAVPEPSAICLLGLGGVALAAVARRKKH